MQVGVMSGGAQVRQDLDLKEKSLRASGRYEENADECL